MRGKRIRLLGVTATHLDEPDQLALFAAEADRQHRVMEAADALNRRFGARAVVRARLLGRRLPAPFERDPSSPLARRGVDDIGDLPEEVTREREPGADAPEADAPDADHPDVDAPDSDTPEADTVVDAERRHGTDGRSGP